MFKKILLLSASVLLITACTSSGIDNESGSNAHLLKTGSDAASYNVELGMSYLQQGDVQRAKRKLLLAIQQAPDWAPAQQAMGYFLLNTGEAKRAEEYYKRAVSLSPQSGAAQNNYGVYLCRMGRYQEANMHYMLAVQDPNYVNTAEAYENAGLCSMQARNGKQALGYFQKAVQQDPKRTTSYLELAQIYYQENNTNVAQQYFNNYAKLAGDSMGPDGLLLGIHLARKNNNTLLAQQYTLQLQNNYPNSNEYRQLLAKTPRRMPLS